MKGKEIFISGIDTGCGKTQITGLLAFHFLRNGFNVITTKLVQTGCSGIAEDILAHRKIMEIPVLPEDKNLQTCPYVFSFPASPHLAAALDKKTIDLSLIRNNINQLKNKYYIILSEGAGGLMVPINENFLIADYLVEYNIPIVLVSSSKLGSINHTLLSLEVCKQKKIQIVAVVYNHFLGDNNIIAENTFSFLTNHVPQQFKNTKIIHSSQLVKTATFLITDEAGFLL